MALAARTQQPSRPRLLQAMLDAWGQEDVRAKLAFVFAMLVVFRFVAHIPIPGVNPAAAASEAKEPARRRPRAERAEPEEPAEPSPLPAAPGTPEPTARRGRAQRAAPEAAAESNPVAGTDKAAETEEENA